MCQCRWLWVGSETDQILSRLLNQLDRNLWNWWWTHSQGFLGCWEFANCPGIFCLFKYSNWKMKVSICPCIGARVSRNWSNSWFDRNRKEKIEFWFSCIVPCYWINKVIKQIENQILKWWKGLFLIQNSSVNTFDKLRAFVYKSCENLN